MDVDSLELGATYYRIAYADVAQTMPSVEPLVYVGLNVFESRPVGADKYYFQDVASVIQFGLSAQVGKERHPAKEMPDSNSNNHDECIYSSHLAEEIGEVIMDLQGLSIEIDSAIKRAIELNFPKLSKATGKWI